MGGMLSSDLRMRIWIRTIHMLGRSTLRGGKFPNFCASPLQDLLTDWFCSHPIVRVHPATGWKSLYVNRAMTVRIVGLDKGESDTILNYLYSVYEDNVDIQVRFKWTPGTSALWDNRYVESALRRCMGLDR